MPPSGSASCAWWPGGSTNRSPAAEQARAASPYLERAHRLAVAAQLQRRDHQGAARAVAEAEAMLADLGLEPEPDTAMLLRQARARLDASRGPDGAPRGQATSGAVATRR